jgi:hypothetical protein
MAGARHLRRQVGALGAIALAAAALAAAQAAGRGETDREVALASVTAAGYDPVVLGPDDLERVRAGSLGGAGRAGNEKDASLELSYYVGVDFQHVPPGGAQLFEIRCPTRGEQPIAGGAQAPVAGLVSVSSSRVNPSSEFPTRPRAWYEAVVNIMSTPLRWKPFVSCGTAKGIIR